MGRERWAQTGRSPPDATWAGECLDQCRMGAHRVLKRRLFAYHAFRSSSQMLALAVAMVAVVLPCTSHAVPPRAYTVHVLPHSHDDVGWVRTVDEYYEDFVKSIYTSAVRALSLEEDPLQRRTFQSVEIAYFSRWWEDATEVERDAVRSYLKAGRWEFAVGGWVMPDEAVTDYASLIVAMTEGHEWLNTTLGAQAVPRFGFQVDPFGASSVFAWHSALMGFDAHVISRINDWDKEQRQATKELEFVWRPSESLGHSAEIFTHVMDQYSYCVPYIPVQQQLDHLCALPTQKDCPGGNFQWDGDDSQPASWWSSHPQAPYPGVNSSNIQFYSDFFVNNTRQRVQWFQEPHVLWPFGCDFQHFNASRMFESMDQIVTYVNSHNGLGERYEGVTVRYSRLSDYFAALHDQTEHTWPVRGSSDFLPYSTFTGDSGSRPWTGFYTSHSELKGLARDAAAKLRAFEQLMAHAGMREIIPSSRDWAALTQMRRAVATLQHHDAVTGTEGPGRRKAASDHPGQVGGVVTSYMETLHNATSVADEVMAVVADRLLVKFGSSGVKASGGIGSGDHAADETTADFKSHDLKRPHLTMLNSGFLQALSVGASATITAYNPLSWSINKWVTVYVPRPDLIVVDSSGTAVLSHVNPTYSALSETPPYQLFFFAELPALGYSSFAVNPAPPLTVGAAERGRVVDINVKGRPGSTDIPVNVTIDNAFYKLVFDHATHLLASVELRQHSGIRHVELDVDLMAYDSFFNASEGAVSGSYVFRPLGPATPYRGIGASPPRLQLVLGTHVNEVRQIFETRRDIVVYRLYGQSAPGEADATVGGFIEIDTAVGPLDGNQEVVLRFSTNLDTQPQTPLTGVTSQFFSDNNGQQIQRRYFNTSLWRGAPDVGTMIAGNYAPMVRSAFIRDSRLAGGLALGLVSSRTHGCTSAESGQLEVMLHRRELQDDQLGACFNWDNQNTTRADNCPASLVPLNVTTRVESKLWAVLDNSAPMSQLRHLLSQAANNPPVLFFSTPGADLQGGSFGDSTHVVDDWMSRFGAQFEPLSSNAVPDSVQVMSMRPMPDGDGNVSGILMRFEHLYEENDDDHSLAATVKLDVTSMFQGLQVASYEERSLSGVRLAPNGATPRWTWPTPFGTGNDDAFVDDAPSAQDDNGGDDDDDGSGSNGGNTPNSNAYIVDLAPQQLRTVFVEFTPTVPRKKSNGLPAGAIAALVSGAVVVVVIGTGLTWKWYDKRRVERARRVADDTADEDGPLLPRRRGRRRGSVSSRTDTEDEARDPPPSSYGSDVKTRR